MKYIHFAQPGPPEVLHLAEGPAPVPGPGEVLIRVAAAGINHPDVLQRAGKYPPPAGASPILGLEVAGTIAAAGPDSSRAPSPRKVASRANCEPASGRWWNHEP